MGYSSHYSSNPTSLVTTSPGGKGGEGAPNSLIWGVRQRTPAEEEVTLCFVLGLGPQVFDPGQRPAGLLPLGNGALCSLPPAQPHPHSPFRMT